MLISKLMHRPAVCLQPEESVASAARKLFVRGLGEAPVVHNKKFVGMFRTGDMSAALLRPRIFGPPSTATMKQLQNETVASRMSWRGPALLRSSDVLGAYVLMVHRSTELLPVVDERMRLVGVVHAADVRKHMIRLLLNPQLPLSKTLQLGPAKTAQSSKRAKGARTSKRSARAKRFVASKPSLWDHVSKLAFWTKTDHKKKPARLSKPAPKPARPAPAARPSRAALSKPSKAPKPRPPKPSALMFWNKPPGRAQSKPAQAPLQLPAARPAPAAQPKSPAQPVITSKPAQIPSVQTAQPEPAAHTAPMPKAAAKPSIISKPAQIPSAQTDQRKPAAMPARNIKPAQKAAVQPAKPARNIKPAQKAAVQPAKPAPKAAAFAKPAQKPASKPTRPVQAPPSAVSSAPVESKPPPWAHASRLMFWKKSAPASAAGAPIASKTAPAKPGASSKPAPEAPVRAASAAPANKTKASKPVPAASASAPPAPPRPPPQPHSLSGSTVIDQIVEYINLKGKASSHDVARHCNLTPAQVETYATSLERNHLLKVEYDVFGGVWIKKI